MTMPNHDSCGVAQFRSGPRTLNQVHEDCDGGLQYYADRRTSRGDKKSASRIYHCTWIASAQLISEFEALNIVQLDYRGTAISHISWNIVERRAETMLAVGSGRGNESAFSLNTSPGNTRTLRDYLAMGCKLDGSFKQAV